MAAKKADRWERVVEMRGKLTADTVYAGLTNTGLLRPDDYSIFAVGGSDTTFYYALEVRATVSRTRRDVVRGFALGAEYAIRLR